MPIHLIHFNSIKSIRYVSLNFTTTETHWNISALFLRKINMINITLNGDRMFAKKSKQTAQKSEYIESQRILYILVKKLRLLPCTALCEHQWGSSEWRRQPSPKSVSWNPDSQTAQKKTQNHDYIFSLLRSRDITDIRFQLAGHPALSYYPLPVQMF